MKLFGHRLISEHEYTSLINKSLQFDDVCNLSKQINEIQGVLNKNLKKIDFLDFIINELDKPKIFLSDVYLIDDNFFCVFVKYNHGIYKSYDIDIVTKTPDFIDNVCISNAEVRDNKMEIVSVDTKYMERCGHGSKHLKTFVTLGKMLHLKSIYGLIWRESPTGFDNLCNFYLKNGFEIRKHSFYMNLQGNS